MARHFGILSISPQSTTRAKRDWSPRQSIAVYINGWRPALEAAIGGSIRLQCSQIRPLLLTFVDLNYLKTALTSVLANAKDSMPERWQSQPFRSQAIRRLIRRLAASRIGLSSPFFTTKPPALGNGLGLSMVHGFLRQSLGRLEIDSEPGYGTTIRTIFPTIGNAADVQRAGVDDVQALGADSGFAEIILVVDDNDVIRELASRYRRAFG